MNRFRRMIPGLVLGLTLSIAGAGFAQGMSQAKPDDKKESCCCVASGCCGDSCPMKQGKHGEKKNHAGTSDKHECCCGDSCSMTKDGAMKEGAMKMGATSDKHACCCEGDSCAMMKDGAMNHEAMKQGAAKSGKHESCCCGRFLQHEGQERREEQVVTTSVKPFFNSGAAPFRAAPGFLEGGVRSPTVREGN